MQYVIQAPDTREVHGLSQASWSPDGKQLVFTESGSGYDGLSIADIDGSNYRQLIEKGAQSARWSPNGRTIAFWSYLHSEFLQGLYVVNADGTNLRHVAEARYVAHIQWSPDSLFLAFNDHTDVWLADLERDVVRKLPRGSDKACYPHWSPNSQLIAYEDDEIWMYDRVSNQRCIITRYGQIGSWSIKNDFAYLVPVMSFKQPDGSLNPPPNAERGTFVLTANGKVVRVGAGVMLAGFAQWSANGEALLFEGRRGFSRGLFLATNNLRTFTRQVSAVKMICPVLSPDGQTIAYTIGDGKLHLKSVT